MRKLRIIKQEEQRFFYVPLRQSEVESLGLTENSKVKVEIARIDDTPSSRPASELESELTRIKKGLASILDGYDEETSIRENN